MSTIVTETTTTTETVDQQGTVIDATTVSTTRKSRELGEPPYVKLYIDNWLSFKGIKGETAEKLFFEIVCRMSYADASDPTGGQIVYLGGPVAEAIKRKLDIKGSRFHRLVSQLCDCGVLKKLQRAVYQINPEFVGRGEWRYNPKKKQGGIENLVATFNYTEGTVETCITFADDGTESAVNTAFREGVGVKASDHLTMTETHVDTRPPEAAEKDQLPFEAELDAMEDNDELSDPSADCPPDELPLEEENHKIAV